MKIMKRLAVAALIVLVLAGCGNSGDDRLDKAIARAKAAGLATTPEELAAKYKPAPGGGLAPLEAITPLSRTQDFRTVSDFSSGKAVDINVKIALGRIGKQAQLFETAAKKGSLPTTRKWSDVNTMLFPEYAEVRAVAKFLCGRAVYRAQTKNESGCLADMDLVAGLIKRTSGDCLLIGKLVNTAVVAIWCRAAERCAEHLQKAPSALMKLAAIAKRLPEPNYREALSGELVFGRTMLENLIAGKGNLKDWLTEDQDAAIGTPSKADLVLAEAKTVDIYAQLAEVWRDRSAVIAIASKFGGSNVKEPADKIVSVFVPVFQNAKDAEIRSAAIVVMTRIGIAALNRRNATGKLPSLGEAAKAAGVSPVDPFSDSGYSYTTSGGLKIYSVGPNGVDDHGARTGPSMDIVGFDVTLK